MRINSKKNSFSLKWLLIIPLTLILYVIFFTNKNSHSNSKNESNTYFCGAEKFDDGVFVTPEKNFQSRCERTTSTSYSGRASCVCGEGQQFALVAGMKELNSFDTVQVSAAAKQGKNTQLQFVLSSDNKHYFSSIIPADNKWAEHDAAFVIPKLDATANWKVYLYKVYGEEPAYFDDFRITIKKFGGDKNEILDFSHIELQINKANFKKITDKRNEAMQKGLLFSSQEDYVDADIRVDSMTIGCKVRLKGDLLDHLYGEKWSYRIRLKDNESWREMKTFSVHYSAARDHLSEWVMHQLMRKEGMITPKTDFFQFSVNDKDMGVFAFEHHFENEMLEENDRLVAPIIRHNDSGYWDNTNGKLKKFNWVPSTQVELFNKENDNQKSFADLYQHGHDQLYNFLFRERKASEVFDMDKMAKYYALIEMGHGTHAQLITNIRFYINPVSGLLEPIGYDFYSGKRPNITEGWRPVGQWENGEDIEERSMGGSSYMVRLFGDDAFFEKYLGYLQEFTNPDYLKKRFDELQNDIKIRGDFIRSDSTYKDYKYDFFDQFKKGAFTRAKLYPLSNVSLKSFRGSSSTNVHLQSFHYFPLKILGYTTSKGEMMLDQPVVMKGYSPNSALKTYQIECKRKPQDIIYQTLGVDSIFYHRISKNILPAQASDNAMTYVNISETDQFECNAGDCIAVKNDIIINRAYKVSEDQNLIIPSGTRLQFQNGGKLFITGGIKAIGTPSEPILFIGNGIRGSGIVLSESRIENQFQNCVFDRLSAYQHRIVSLDAAVQIDQSKVRFENCRWKSTNAPSDLKFNNSDFEMYNCSFDDNAGIALQSYYSVGKFENIEILNYGKGGFKQVGGNISGKGFEIKDLQGVAFSIDDFAITKIDNISLEDCRESLIVSGHSDVRFNGYSGKATYRDIQVTGDQKPYTKVILVNVKDASNLSYFLSPKATLSINYKKKRMK